jgi:bacterioferritin-associated ferredoxin
MMSFQLDTELGFVELRLSLTSTQKIMHAEAHSEASRAQIILDWLAPWLKGKELISAQSTVGETILVQHPDWSLAEARFCEALLKEAVFRTHRKVEVSGVIVCTCRKVTRETIVECLTANPGIERTDLTRLCSAGSGCGSCIGALEALVEKHRPQDRRWHGEPYSRWVLKIEETLQIWRERNPAYPELTVKTFQNGVVKVLVEGTLTADQEWDLTRELTDYWAEGFPAPLSVFLDFSLAQTSKISSIR